MPDIRLAKAVLARKHGMVQATRAPTGEHSDPVCCNLQVVPLHANISYEALSYCWGDAKQTLPISINSHTLPVTINLRAALRHLRRETAPRMLWVDAICIDQNELAERGSQVAMMAQIYRNATRTVVWLGPSGKGSRQALRTLKILKQQHADHTSQSTLGENKIATQPAVEDAVDIPQHPRAVEELRDDVSSLFARPYFNRVWVVQELALARGATVVCGLDTLPWMTLVEGLMTGLNTGFFETQLLGVVAMDSGYANVLALSDSTSKDIQSEDPAARLLHLLYSHRGREATDPADKVYSLLSLCGDDAAALGIKPDYQRSFTATYRAAAVTLLREGADLDLLGMRATAGKGVAVNDLPAWVPNWSITEWQTVPLTIIDKDRARRLQATRGSRPNLRFSADQNLLFLSGHTVDSIAEVSTLLKSVDEDAWFNEDKDSYPKEPEHVEHTVPAEASVWQHIGSYVRHDLPFVPLFLGWTFRMFWWAWKELLSSTEALECFAEWESFAKITEKDRQRKRLADDCSTSIYWKTLCAGNRLEASDTATEAAFWEWHDMLAPTRRLLKMHGSGLTSNTLRSAAFVGHLQKTWNAYSRFNEVLDHAYNRRLARTKNGHLALVPGDAQAGDPIVLCMGGRVPLCVRRGDDAVSTLLGEAYVHALMDGRAFDESQCEAIALR